MGPGAPPGYHQSQCSLAPEDGFALRPKGLEMSHFLDRLTFFNRVVDDFSDGHGITTNEDRRWEDGYRKRWQHDKIVRSTHGVNCTGSCSWKVYVKGGIVTWETQQTDYPRTRPELPNHEPRGCARDVYKRQGFKFSTDQLFGLAALP